MIAGFISRIHAPALALLVVPLACGDDGRATGASASATSTATGPGTTGSGSTDDLSTGGDGTGSTTSPPTTSTAATTTQDATTTGGPPLCGEDTPKGFIGPFDAACAVEPQIGMFTPLVEWRQQTWTTFPGSVYCRSMPVIVQISDDDGDGKIGPDDVPDIVLVTGAPTVMRGLSGDGSQEHFNVELPGVANASTLAAGDIDGDGVVEFVIADGAGHVLAYEHDGAAKWMSEPIPQHIGMLYNSPAISDMDGDGSPEIVVGRAILDAAGTLVADPANELMFVAPYCTPPR